MKPHPDLSFSKLRLYDYPSLIRALLEVKEAAAQANYSNELITSIEFEKITQCISLLKSLVSTKDRLELSNFYEMFSSDPILGGGCIALHLNILDQMGKLSGLPHSTLNQSQSTADVFHTAFRIAIYRDTEPLLKILTFLQDTLATQSIQWSTIKTLSRTCLQDAIPVSLGKSWKNYSDALDRRSRAIQLASEELLKVNLGGTVVGSCENASPGYFGSVLDSLNTITGLPLVRRPNLYDAAQNSDDLGSYHSSLVQITQLFMKFARDLRLLSSGPKGGLGEIRLPIASEGSTFFSGKINPILPETVLQCGFQVMGADYSIQLALQNAELNLNVFEGSIAFNILNSLRDLTHCLQKFTEFCVVGIAPNQERCEELAQFQFPVKGNEKLQEIL